MRIVMKFGGSSLASAEHIRRAAARAAQHRKRGEEVIVVVSAQGDTTDRLLEQMEQVHPAPPLRERDAFLSCGEQMSMALMAAQLERMNVPAVSLCGWQAGIRTDDRHGEARIVRVDRRRIVEELSRGRVVVVAGFQGIDDKKDITTIGRGGSDTTAVALAAALRADLCVIYTDVDGVYSADPRLVPDAIPYHAISYDEMQEMAELGAQVLHARSVALAKRHHVVIQVCSSILDGGASTTVCADCGLRPPVRGVVCTETETATLASAVGEAAVLSETKQTVSDALEQAGLPCRAIRQEGMHLTAVLPSGQKARAANLLHGLFFPGNDV